MAYISIAAKRNEHQPFIMVHPLEPGRYHFITCRMVAALLSATETYQHYG